MSINKITQAWLLAAYIGCLGAFLPALDLPSQYLPNFIPAAATPAQAEPRNPELYPQGYYNGDPMPASTIYLSFDDGPSDFTEAVLDILDQEKVRATFFLNAYNKEHPNQTSTKINILLPYAAVLKRMVAAGHVIGNHTFSHQDLGQLSPQGAAFQLNTLERQLKAALGDATPPMRLVRPPFGSPWLGTWGTDAQKRQVAAELRDRGLVMMWTIGWDSSDSREWASGEWFKATSARYHPGGVSYVKKMQRELDRILRRADGKTSGIILMHDMHPTSKDVLQPMIRELKARGYTFATLEDYAVWRWGPQVFERYDQLSIARGMGSAREASFTNYPKP